MNPLYRVQIDVCLKKPASKDNIWMRRMSNLPYAPREGDTIVVESDDGEETLELTFDRVVYSVPSGQFEADITDTTLVDEIEEEGVCNESKLLAQYQSFGFLRLNIPVAQVVRP